MFSIDLQKITVAEFSQILKSIDLLPGRRILLNNLDQVVLQLNENKVKNLADLQTLLKNKSKYSNIADMLSTTEAYLTVLNREINSYQSKPVDIKKIDVFSDNELNLLAAIKIKTTKDIYNRLQLKSERNKISIMTNIPGDKLVEALEISDLLRITGVGLVFANILREIGINNTSVFMNSTVESILGQYHRINQKKGLTRANLGTKDIEYCKRFGSKLDQDIEW